MRLEQFFDCAIAQVEYNKLYENKNGTFINEDGLHFNRLAGNNKFMCQIKFIC